MASLNEVKLIGYLGQDPEKRFLPDGTPTARLSLATTESWKTDSGEKKERTEWHRVICYGRLGEICSEYLTKGRQVYIDGRLQTRKWNKDGQDHYTTEIVARKMLMLGVSGKGQANGQASEPAGGWAPQPGQAEDDVPF
jgi:single-strand DNA-binding protein